MQVHCAQCHAANEIEDGSIGSAERQLCAECGATLPPTEPLALKDHGLSWLVLLPGGQAGPYDAAQMARLLDGGAFDWSCLVWRQALKGWRPARRDAELVTATAAARDASVRGDTVRVSAHRSLLPATDTIVEPAPAYGLEGPRRPSRPLGDWAEHSTDVRAERSSQPSPEPTLADAFRSAPSILGTESSLGGTSTVPVPQRKSSPNSWLPSAQSMLIVALVAFASGVLVAALWGRLANSSELGAPTIMVRRPTSEPARADAPPQPEPPAPAPEVRADVTSIAPVPDHETPSAAELRQQVKLVSPDVRRCVNNLVRGAELEVVFEGATGRVRDVRLRTQGLTPGRVECITQAVRQMRVAAFRDADFRFRHKFSY